MNNEPRIVAVLLLCVSCTDSPGSPLKFDGPKGGATATATNDASLDTTGKGGAPALDGNGSKASTASPSSGGASTATPTNGGGASTAPPTSGGGASPATSSRGGGGSKQISAVGGVSSTGVGGTLATGGSPTTKGGSTAAVAGTTRPTTSTGSTTASTPTGDSSCLQPGNGKYSEPGPYKTARKDSVDLSSLLSGAASPTTFSIIYPDPLEANCLHPIVAWGNGTGVTGQGVYDFFNVNAASWGMVVIASDNSNVGSGQYHKAGIDYLLKENENPSSIFYHKLSTRAGTSGHSQGGMGATVASAHPNVVAEVCVAGAGTVGAKVAFLCLTGTEDMVETQCTATYKAAPGPAFLGDWEGGDHVSTETVAGYLLRDPGSLQMQRLYSAWFRCYLANDRVACAMFSGTPCGICNESGWSTIAGRNIK